jgi:hypothetical protein
MSWHVGRTLMLQLKRWHPPAWRPGASGGATFRQPEPNRPGLDTAPAAQPSPTSGFPIPSRASKHAPHTLLPRAWNGRHPQVMTSAGRAFPPQGDRRAARQSGIGTLTPSLPSMRGWFTPPYTAFRCHTTAQVKGAARDRGVGGARLRVAQFLANLWQGPCTAVHGMDAGAIVRSPAHSRLAPPVQCCPEKKWVEVLRKVVR